MTIKEFVEARARAMAEHDQDNYGPIYVVGAANAIIADVLKARDDLLAAAPAAGAEIAPAASEPTAPPEAEVPVAPTAEDPAPLSLTATEAPAPEAASAPAAAAPAVKDKA